MISRIGPVPNIADSSGVCCPHDAPASRKPAILANADQITRAPFVAFQRAAATESNRYHVIAAYENPAEHSSNSRAGSREPSVECHKSLLGAIGEHIVIVIVIVPLAG